jgi:hypothetical protein
MLFRAPRYIRRLPLGFETSLNALALILHIDGHRPISAIGNERQVWTRGNALTFLNNARALALSIFYAGLVYNAGAPMVCLFHGDYGPEDPAFTLASGSPWVVKASSLKDARNIGEAEAIQRHLLRGEPVSWCDQGYAWVGQEAVGWFYAAAFLLIVLPYLVTRIKARAKDRSRLQVAAGGAPRPVADGRPQLPN